MKTTSSTNKDFDLKKLEDWLVAHVSNFQGPIKLKLLAGGQSNPTYLVDTPAANFVLRRRPPGNLAPSAHAVHREYQVLRALSAGALAPVPAALAYCADDSVIGTAFYVMSWVNGRVFQDPQLPEVPPKDRRSYWESAIETLARVHMVDWRSSGLESFGRPDRYLERQIDRWTQLYTSETAAGRIPVLEKVIDWLSQHVPSSNVPATIVHGDYRVDNLMFHPVESSVLAILDWELATLGNPLADFAYCLMIYRLPSLAFPGLLDVNLDAAKLPSEAELIRLYSERTGRREGIPDLGYYTVFSMFRLTAILHGIRGRLLRGTAVSDKARDYARHVETLAAIAWQQTRLSAENAVPLIDLAGRS